MKRLPREILVFLGLMGAGAMVLLGSFHMVSRSRDTPVTTPLPVSALEELAARYGSASPPDSPPLLPDGTLPEESPVPGVSHPGNPVDAAPDGPEGINIAELYMVMGDDPGSPRLARRWRFRGRIYQNRTLSARGTFGVYRVVINCCAADATAAAVELPLDSLPEGLHGGEWVEVTGHLAPAQSPGASPGTIEELDSSGAGAPVAALFVVARDYVFRPDQVILLKNQGPPDPYVYEWAEAAPYHY